MYLDPSNGGPGTHVLAIGVGAYPHLAVQQPIMGLTPLTSPPASAAAIAEFFRLKYRNPKAPIESIDLLASPQHHPAANGCTIDELQVAATNWFDRCNSHPDNVAILFFCGHGLQRGSELALLADDFGKKPAGVNPMNEAFNLPKLIDAFAHCIASTQCFFIDSCRDLPLSEAKKQGDFGVTLIQPMQDAANPGRDYSLYYATGVNSRAFGRPGKPSRFTSALLRAFEGPGADESNGEWFIDTSSLQRGLKAMFDLENDQPNMPAQKPLIGGQTNGAFLHRLDGPPDIPVLLGCDPTSENAQSKLRLNHPGGQQFNREGEPADWELELPVATYNLEFSHPNREERDSLVVWPPRRTRRFKVA